jgi:pimeloyl-ACP methyl ester carboxylesterase
VDPHRAKRVVCCNAVGLWRDDLPTLDFFSEDMGKVQPAVWFDPTGPAALSILPDMSSAEKIAESMFKYAVSLSAAAKFLWPIPERGLHKRLHRISAPTMLLWGEHDRLVSAAYAEEFKSRIKDARVAIFDKSGHFPMIEEPDKFVETVVGFLRG